MSRERITEVQSNQINAYNEASINRKKLYNLWLSGEHVEAQSLQKRQAKIYREIRLNKEALIVLWRREIGE